MAAAETDCVTLRFSTESIPPADRIPFWREVFGRTIIRLDIEPLPDLPFYSRGVVQTLPGLGIYSAVTSGMRTQRTRDLLADGNDDLILFMQRAGRATNMQGGRDVILAKGEAMLVTNAELGAMTHHEDSRRIGVRLPRTALKGLVPNVEGALVRPIPRDNDALRLLIGYVKVCQEPQTLSSPKLRQLVVTHVYDLAALAIGASREAAAIAEGRGLRAARLSAIKANIAENLAGEDFSVAEVAARQRVSPRYVQMLFESEGTTFSEYVLNQRLACAHRLLTDPRSAGLTITAIAFEAGFSDLSYFNRAFRRLYGAPPSEVREAARRGGAT